MWKMLKYTDFTGCVDEKGSEGDELSMPKSLLDPHTITDISGDLKQPNTKSKQARSDTKVGLSSAKHE